MRRFLYTSRRDGSIEHWFGGLIADEVEREQGENDPDKLFAATALDSERWNHAKKKVVDNSYSIAQEGEAAEKQGNQEIDDD